MSWTHLYWASWSDFWAMGGYGWYVWGSLGVTVVLIACEVWQVRHARRQALRHLAEMAILDELDRKASQP